MNLTTDDAKPYRFASITGNAPGTHLSVNYGQQPFVNTPPAGYAGLYQTWDEWSLTPAQASNDKIYELTRVNNKQSEELSMLLNRLKQLEEASGHTYVAPETPVAVEGYYPLYTEQYNSNNDVNGDGTSHSHEFSGVTYYMPNGLDTFYHGDYTGS